MSDSYSLYPFEVFRTVARSGSATRAAKKLFISQPAVSAHLKALEQRFEETLFERSPGGMVLTDVGRDLLEHLDRLFALYEELPGVVEASRGTISGAVALAASSTPGTYLVPAALSRFHEQYPKASTTLMVGNTAEVLQWLHEYRAPLAVVGEVQDGENLHGLKIGCDLLSIVASPKDPIAGAGQLRTEDVREKTLFIRTRGSSTGEATRKLLGDLLPSFGRIVEIGNSETIKHLVMSGLGVAVLSSWTIELEQKSGLLVSVPDGRFRKCRDFYLVRRKDRVLTGTAAALWECLGQCRAYC